MIIFFSGMWNKPSRSHSPVSPNVYRSPTLVKANFTPPTSPPPTSTPGGQIPNTRPPPHHSPHRSNPPPQLRSKTPGKSLYHQVTVRPFLNQLWKTEFHPNCNFTPIQISSSLKYHLNFTLISYPNFTLGPISP